MKTPLTFRKARRIILGAALLALIVSVVYVALVRPWHLSWGATDEEMRRKLPGDDVVPNASNFSTRAITIDAPAEDVWPWLVQIGWNRGGFYSYNWVENLMGGDLHNAERIHPEWQDLRVGDEVWMAPPERYGDVSKLVVAEMQPDRALVYYKPGGTWAFVLEPVDEESTRLIVRGRGTEQEGLVGAAYYYGLFEPGHFLMERRMLLGIKERTERAKA